MLYVRKYNPVLWNKKCVLDAVSISDLSTEDNDISVWQVADDKCNIDDIALAIALTRDRIQDFYIVFLKDNYIRENNLSMNPMPGDTKYNKIKNEHNNIKVPTFWEIGYLAEYMHQQIESNNIEYCSEKKLKIHLYNAIKNKCIPLDEINSKENRKIKKAFEEMEEQYGKIENV